jgi:hypothetical protein
VVHFGNKLKYFRFEFGKKEEQHPIDGSSACRTGKEYPFSISTGVTGG